MQVDLTPLLRGERGEAIRIAGVRVGDPAANVDRGALTGASPDSPGTARRRRGNARFPQASDLTEEPLLPFFWRPSGENLAEALRGSGSLRCGTSLLRVMDGVIERIFVGGPAIASLGIVREADIERRLGPAVRATRLGQRLYRYPARGVVVTCEEEGQIVHVALGPEPRFGAADLLSDLLFSYVRLAPSHWAEPGGGSLRIRYRRMAALARALGLGAVPDVAGGGFLRDKRDAKRLALRAEVAARAELGGVKDDDEDFPSFPNPLGELFGYLLRYRHEVDDVVRTTESWYCCSDRGLLGMLATQNHLGRRMVEMMAEIDRWLCTLIDPEDRSFELDELIERHGWPDSDLEEAELDEL